MAKHGKELLRFCPIFDPFFVPKRPLFKAYWDFPWPKTRHHGLKTGQKHLFEDPKWSRNNFETNYFFAPGTPVEPPLAPTVHGLCCPPATRSDHRYEGVGVSLCDSEAWKPQKVGGCGWNRCPRNSVLSHVARDTARSLFWPCWTQITHS